MASAMAGKGKMGKALFSLGFRLAAASWYANIKFKRALKRVMIREFAMKGKSSSVIEWSLARPQGDRLISETRDARWGAANYPMELDACLKGPIGPSQSPVVFAKSLNPFTASLNPFALPYSGTLTRLLVAVMGRASDSSANGVATRRHPLDWVDGMDEWDIGGDESLDARHPIVARAWARRAAEVENIGSAHEREALAFSLAWSMLGRCGNDGLHPDYALDAQNSRWAGIQIKGLCKKACEIAETLRESQEIRRDLADPIGQKKVPSKSL